MLLKIDRTLHTFNHLLYQISLLSVLQK